MNKILVLYPNVKERAYKIAGEEFVKYFSAMTDYTPTMATEDDGVSDLVVIGSSAVNKFYAEHRLGGKLPKLAIRATTDDFAVKTCTYENRNVLLLQGGLGRSTLYAVYAYFNHSGCAWFWDGDVVPKKSMDELWGKDIDILEKSRFQYRGLRYFAHRGCKRFQAEMWGFEDWKKEIDYLVKRKLNLFMLRIGQDDLFQKAFPDAVPYPTEDTMDKLCEQDEFIKGGFFDRRLFWPLKYRGELRKKVLAYAFDRGLIHPEDCGTMTHWYSLTPIDFIENKKPTFFSDDSDYHTTGSVWDIREQSNFENYMALTTTHISEYGKAEVFHTIGFAERLYSDDREKNLEMKKYMYDRYLQRLKEEYPTCPVFIASWDLWRTYKGDEVERLVSTLDKNQCIILDYTSDSLHTNNFTNWNIIGKFPYTFGIFHGYACDNDCLGYYSVTEERMTIAKNDSQCKGMIFWPELSHSDTLMQEFFVENAWAEEVVSVDKVIEKMCANRYEEYAEDMCKVWKLALPVISLAHWSMRPEPNGNPEYYYLDLKDRFIPWVLKGESEKTFLDGMDMEKAKNATASAKECFVLLNKLSNSIDKNEFMRRDIVDIARTLVGRYVNILLTLQGIAIVEYRKTGTNKEKIVLYMQEAQKGLELLKQVLSTHEDFSLYHTLTELNRTEKVYEGFEETLKNNTINWYCRTSIYESVKEVYIPELAYMNEMLLDCMDKGEYKESRLEEFKTKSNEIVNAYIAKPFTEIHKDGKSDLKQIIKKCKNFFETLDV